VTVSYAKIHIVLGNSELHLAEYIKMFDLAVSSIGSVGVTTTNNKGHDPEFWADIATQQIVSVGGECHPAIKEQAEAFKLQVFNAVKYYMDKAIESDRTTLVALLDQNQQQDIADIIRRL